MKTARGARREQLEDRWCLGTLKPRGSEGLQLGTLLGLAGRRVQFRLRWLPPPTVGRHPMAEHTTNWCLEIRGYRAEAVPRPTRRAWHRENICSQRAGRAT